MWIDWLSAFMLALGCFLSLIGGLGLHKFSDFYQRIHAASVTDTLCVFLILAGLSLQAGFSLVSVKLFMIFAFLFFTNPTSSYCLGHAAVKSGLKPKHEEE